MGVVFIWLSKEFFGFYTSENRKLVVYPIIIMHCACLLVMIASFGVSLRVRDPTHFYLTTTNAIAVICLVSYGLNFAIVITATLLIIQNLTKLVKFVKIHVGKLKSINEDDRKVFFVWSDDLQIKIYMLSYNLNFFKKSLWNIR